MKKSKFLKKSLAMLLALMLVVAMIPLSASAALPDDLQYIYVDGNVVSLKNGEVDVKSDDKDGVTMKLNQTMAAGWELRVKPVSATELNWITLDATTNKQVDLAKYMDASGNITLVLRHYVTANWIDEATYTIAVNKVAVSTTTNVEYVGNVKGVYSAAVDTVNKVVNVVLARDDDQATLDAQMIMRPLDNAEITANQNNVPATVPADNGDTFTVTSESGNNVATYKVVATYLDALSSVTVTGLNGEKYTGTPVDANDDDIPDTIVVNLPQEAIEEQKWNDVQANPVLGLGYVTEGDVTANAVVKKSNENTRTPVKPDGSLTVTFNGLGDDDADYEWKGIIEVNRLPETYSDANNANGPTGPEGAVQTYNLTVQVEKSSDTEITYAKVNDTLATVDAEAGTIVAALPNADAAMITGCRVELRTADTVKSVTIDGKSVTGTPGVGYTTWSFSSAPNLIDLSKSKIVDVVAEDGTKQQYTLSASFVTNVTDATISAIWIKDNTTQKTYEADVTAVEDNLYVEVPYMTTNVADWTIFVTPASYTYVTYSANNAQLVNGETKLSDINGSLSTLKINPDQTWSLEITARNKNTASVSKTYTLTIGLMDPKDGNTLTDLDFSATAQTNDRDVYRNIERDVNTFDAQIDTHSNNSDNVTNLNLKVPVSLTSENDLGLTYRNVVTSFATANGGVAYIVKESNSGGYYVADLKAINPNNSKDSYGLIANPEGTTILVDSSTFDTANKGFVDTNGISEVKTGFWQILVLPEKTARAYENGTNEGAGAWVSDDEAEDGTLYNVNITVDNASNKSELLTFKVGNTELKVNSDGTITGELPFSATVKEGTAAANMGTFVEFSLSDYARLMGNSIMTPQPEALESARLFSKGDINEDGNVDGVDWNWNGVDIATGNYSGYNNFKLVFERAAEDDNSVNVYLDGGNGHFHPLKNLVVEAENRLEKDENNGKFSSSTYTFDLTWAAPNEEAEIESFKLGGYTGVINNDAENGRTIKVQVPYGTDVTGLVAEFTASSGATLHMNSENGLAFESGVTSANYTMPVRIYITSEDGDTTHMYTVTVEEGISFTDVNPGDWFYDNVMDAAENGYVSGMGDGTFGPKNATTRAQFAAMIANAMGYESKPDTKSMFPDVPDSYWGVEAINFCAENGIISGYEDGTFQPEKAITRQEAAAILNNAFELAEKYGISTEKFPDNGVIADWAADHVYAAKAAGLMKGDADTGNFRPTSTITRAEAASILMNANRAGLIK